MIKSGPQVVCAYAPAMFSQYLAVWAVLVRSGWCRRYSRQAEGHSWWLSRLGACLRLFSHCQTVAGDTNYNKVATEIPN